MLPLFDYSPFFFDLDGLLVNTEKLHYLAYKKVLENAGLTFPWTFLNFVETAHKSHDSIYQLFCAHHAEFINRVGWTAIYEEKQNIYEKSLDNGLLELMPGAKEFLLEVQIRKIPYGVVTNSPLNHTKKIREMLPILEKIPYWITREDYSKPKPFPDPYLKGREIIGESTNMIGFEDSEKGIISLNSAGIQPVLICDPSTLHAKKLPEGTVHATSFLELLKKSN